MADVTAKFSLNNENLNATFDLSEENTVDAIFKIDAAGTTWGSIDGTLSNQTDLQAELDAKADKSTVEADIEILSDTVAENYTTLDNKIDGVQSDLSGDISALSNTVTSNNAAVNNRIDTTDLNLENLSTTVNSNNAEVNGRIDATNQVVIDLSTTVNDNNTAINNRVDDLSEQKQNALTPGANIKIVDDVISATDTTYTAGTGISIVDGVISNTQTSAEWGNITGTLSNQEDLQSALNLKADDNTVVHTSGNEDIYGYKTFNNATYFKDTIASVNNTTDRTALRFRSGTNGTQFYIGAGLRATLTSDLLSVNTPINANTPSQDETQQKRVTTIGYVKSAISTSETTLNNTITASASTINARIDSEVDDLNAAITAEATTRESADNALQSQIDAITAASDVVDIVGTYAQLQAYNTSALQNNDIIKVLSDESRDDETTYYRWIITGGAGAWSFIGEEGPYYTKSEADSTFVPLARTINNKALSQNITLAASDVGALPADTQIGNGTITLTQGGVQKGVFTLNQTESTTIDFDAAGSTITIDSSLSTSSENPVQNKVITTELNKKIEGITSSDVTTALGYTPYNASNPNGYITSEDLPTNYVTTDTAQDISGRKTFLGEKAIYFKQNATSNKLGFTLYNPSNSELGAFEYRPGTISGGALLNVNVPATSSNYVGFRYWGTPATNIVAPKAGGDYYIPVNITDGTTTVTANNTGTVDISTLLTAALSDYATTSALSSGLAGKQNTLTAGENIQINGDTISATDTTYTAGTGISIVNGVISNTQTSAEWGNITGTLSEQADLQSALNAKQNTISDLETIRSGASAGATAVQPATLNNYVAKSEVWYDSGSSTLYIGVAQS